VSRFLHSHSMHQAFDRCRAQFLLLQQGAERSTDPTNLLFGKTFHLFAQKYRDHCIDAKRWSDVEIVGDLVDEAFRTTGLSTQHYEPMTILCRRFVTDEPIDIERSLMREGGIALDENLNLVPWSPSFEYDAPDFREAIKERGVVIRMQLDEVLIDASNRLLLIDDWKTDHHVPSISDIQNPALRWWKQAMQYAWGAMTYLYPDALAVECRFKFVRWGVTRTLLVTKEDVERYAEMFLRRYRFIEETTSFLALPGEHCRMCPFLGGACPIPNESAQYETPVENMAAQYVYGEAIREQRREALKVAADATGTVMVGGLPVLIFEQVERRVLDVQKTLAALENEGIENPELLLDVSVTKLKDSLDADQLERVLPNVIQSAEAEIVFNVHQNKAELVALAESLGIPEPKKLKVAQLAQAIARAAKPLKAA
jgi:hypothetical protein